MTVLDERRAVATLARRSPWPGRARRAAAVLVAAAAAQVCAPAGWGWPFALAVLGASVWSLRAPGRTLLGIVVPLVWGWIGVTVLLSWVGPFRPGLVGPATLTVVAGLPAVWCSPEPAGPPRLDVAGWVAGVAPAVVLAIPFALHASTAGLVSVLGSAWDNVHHLAVMRAALQAGGEVIVSPDPASLLAVALLDMPGGAHQVWAAWGSLVGLTGTDGDALVHWYAGCLTATYALLGCTAVWAFRRLRPAATVRSGAAGLAVVTLALLVAPLPGLWASGFPNYVLALAGLLLLVGLTAPAPRHDRAALWLGCVVLAASASAYVLVTPVAVAAWLVAAVRVWRARGVREVALPVIAAGAGLLPVVLPYLDGPRGAGVGSAAGALSAPGGLVPVSFTALAALAACVVAGVARDRGLRRALVGSLAPLATALVLSAGVVAVTLVEVGRVGYYADKVCYVAAVCLLPAAAAGAAALAAPGITTAGRAGAGRRSRVAIGVGILAVGLALDVALPREPQAARLALPGPQYLASVLAAEPLSWADGDRVVALGTAAGRAGSGRVVVSLPSVTGDGSLDPPSREIEAFWVDLFAPSDASAARMLAVLEREVATTRDAVCVPAVFAHHHPGLGVVLVAGDDAVAAQARGLLPGCPGRPDAVSVVVAAVPPAPAALRPAPAG